MNPNTWIDAVLIGFGVIAFVIGVVLYVVQFRQGLARRRQQKMADRLRHRHCVRAGKIGGE